MIDPLEGGGLVVAGGAAMKALDFLVSRFVRRAESHEEAREKAVADKLDQVLRELAELKLEVRADRERAAAVTAAVAETKSRIDGISANHGPRLGSLEQEFAAMRARIDGLEARKRR